MNVTNRVVIYVGTVRGTIAHTNCVPGEIAKFDLSQIQKGAEISTLTWGRDDNEILIGNRNGIVNTYNIATGTYEHTLSNLEGKGAVTGIAVLDHSILVALRSGHVNIWNSVKTCECFSLNLDDKGTLDCFAQNLHKPNVVAMGGVSNDLKIWDIEAKRCIYKAKSMGHDELNLPLPTSVRGLVFLRNSFNLVSCVTKEGNVLLYDDRAQRKPVSVLAEKNASYTTIATTYKDDNCVVGTTKGYMQVLDVRKPLKVLRTLKSFTGSITGITCADSYPLVASVSLDRYLRLHDMETKQLIHKEYMKHNLTSIIMRPVVKTEPADVQPTEADKNDAEYEELFEEMEVIVDAPPQSIKGKRTAEQKNLSSGKKKVKTRATIAV